MDSAVETGAVYPSEARLEGLGVAVGEKRPAENGDSDELRVPSPKKARNGKVLVDGVKKVAEIVLVLAAMGRIRVGRIPTVAEREMMAEAREKLARVCEGFAPKDVFPRDAFGAVIDDLGLNKLKEQRLGFRSPKMSIAEKLLFTKQKMEKSQEFSLHSVVHSSQKPQNHLGVAAEGLETMTTSRMLPSDKPSHALGGFQPRSTLGHVSTVNSTISPYQLPASEVRTSVASSGLPNYLVGKVSTPSTLPKVERQHFRLDPISNGSSSTPQVQANSTGDQAMLKTSSWSQQYQSASSVRFGEDNKVLVQPSSKFEQTMKVYGNAGPNISRVVTQAVASKPLTSQATSAHVTNMHQNLHGVQKTQPPLFSNVHIEIGKIVQKLLQPQVPEHPTWTPPSRDYMNKALTCQVCKLTINEVENVLVCDACEKGYHLICLQTYNQRTIPRGEWHCFKCLSISNGKTLPPKYGCVTRNMNTPKVSSKTAVVQSSPGKKIGTLAGMTATVLSTSEKKVGTLNGIVNQPKLTSNGSVGLQSLPVDGISNDHNHLMSWANMPNAREMQGDNVLSHRAKIGDKHHLETCPNEAIKTSRPDCISSAVAPSFERPGEEKQVFELKGQRLPAIPPEASVNQLHASSDSQDIDQKGLPSSCGIQLDNCHSNLKVKDSETFDGRDFDGNLNYDIEQDQQQIAQAEFIGSSRTNNQVKDIDKSSDDSYAIDWIGDILQAVDDHNYYQSCCIGGVVYRLQDYAIFHSFKGKLMPSKIQAMWEDKKTGSKWVSINLCYFPSDLPATVGRPCSYEVNEVYESNHGKTILAGLIQGLCEVLPQGKYDKEIERRSHLEPQANDELQPIFLCKWFYDETKGVFRDVLSYCS